MDLILAAAFGVMTHFAQFDNVAAMPLFKQLGATHIRDEQYWNHIEGQPRVFTFPAKFTSYMAAAKSNGLATLIVLDWSNRYYDYSAGDFTFPYTDAGRAAFVRYALEILAKYPEIKAVEVWNEVNAGTFIKGPATSDKAGYYALLLKALYPALKAARPDLIVIAGATVPVAHGLRPKSRAARRGRRSGELRINATRWPTNENQNTYESAELQLCSVAPPWSRQLAFRSVPPPRQ